MSANDSVLDFGCGGGFLLKEIACKERFGIEVNYAAAQIAQSNGLQIFQSSEEVPTESLDVIISNNALEHALNPLDELKSLLRPLKVGGKIIFVVPCESISHTYKPNDVNHHLYSWSPMALGNLFTEAGYILIESKPYIHKWPPKYKLIAKIGGRRGFEFACRLYGHIERSWFQIRAVGTKGSHN